MTATGEVAGTDGPHRPRGRTDTGGTDVMRQLQREEARR